MVVSAKLGSGGEEAWYEAMKGKKEPYGKYGKKEYQSLIYTQKERDKPY